MLDRNALFSTKNRKNDNSENVEDFLKSLKIQVEKFDFESIYCFPKKLELLTAIDQNDYPTIVRVLDEVDKTAQSLKCENYADVKSLCIKAEHLKRLVK